MCGIAGAFRLDGVSAPALPEHVLRSMTDVIAYRGPDDAGHVSGEGCSLGARRLSIIDVEGGHQPFSDERGRVWAAQNGEIYNHDALREELRGARPRAAQPLRHRGAPAPLRGARPRPGRAACAGCSPWRSGTAIERRGVLIRDRLGIKPLYYALAGRRGGLRLRAEVPCSPAAS